MLFVHDAYYVTLTVGPTVDPFDKFTNNRFGNLNTRVRFCHAFA